MSTIPISSEIADDITDLGTLLGLVRSNGAGPELNTEWFGDPVGNMAGVLSDTNRRQVLVDRAADLLGSTPSDLDLPDLADDEAWIPFVDVSSGPATGGLYLVIDTGGEAPVLSLGARIAVSRVGVDGSATVRVPLVMAKPDDGITLLPGTIDGTIEMAATILVDGLGVPEVVTLDGICISAAIPTSDDADLSLVVVAKNLLLPGDVAPVDIALGDAVDELGAAAIQVFAGLLASQGDAPAAVQDLLALIGLDPTGVIPSLPIGDIIADGIPAIRLWVSDVVATNLDIWLDRLGSFLGGDGSPISPTGSGTALDPHRVCLTDDNIQVCLTLVVQADGPTGSLLLTPGASIRANTPVGNEVSGFVEGQLSFAELLLDQNFTVASRPTLRAIAQLGDGDFIDTTVDATQVKIGAIRGGLSATADGTLVPVVELFDVEVDSASYDVIDLTDADAVIAAATTGLIDIVIDALNLGVVTEAKALAILVGLDVPDGTVDWPQVDLVHLLADPIGAIGCYHVDVLSVTGRWQTLVEQLAIVLGSAIGTAPVVGGTGTVADPWTVTVFDNTSSADAVTGAVELVAWTVAAGGGDSGPTISLGLRTHPSFDAGTIDADVAYRAEILRVELPSAATCPAPVGLVWAPTHTVALTITEPKIVLDPITVTADRIELGLDLDRATGIAPRFAAPGVSLTIDGTTFGIGDIDLGDLGAIGGLDDFTGLDWSGLQLLLGDWLAGLGADVDIDLGGLGRLGAELAALLGWKPGDSTPFTFPQLPDLELDVPALPALDLELLLSDPLDALLGWFGALFGGGDAGTPIEFPAFMVAIGKLAHLLTGDHLDVPDFPGITLDGRGTYDDPWAICLAGGPLELVLWLDPDGPNLGGVVAIADHLLADDVLGGTDVDAALALLERAARLAPEISDRLGGTGAVIDGLAALRTILEGDGIVTASAQAVDGWTTTALSPTAHFLEPGDVVLPQAVLDDITPERRIFVSSSALPGTAAWPNDPTLVDVSEPGIRPESINLSAHTDAAGPWHVLLPSRADAVVPTDATVSGVDRLTERLALAISHIHGIVGGDIALIAHSTTGQIARLAASGAASDTNVTHVVTVGTPHGGASFEHFDRPETAGALRAFQALSAMVDDAVLRAADVLPLTNLLDSIGAALDPYFPDADDIAEFVTFPASDFAVPAVYPDLGAGTTGHAVIGSIAGTELDAAIIAFVRRVIEAGIGLLPDGAAATHLGIGLRARLVDSPGPLGTVAVRGRARLDLHHFRISPGDSPRQVPFASIDLELRRVGGWLLGGPDPSLPPETPRDPRARWLETHLRVDPTDLDAGEVDIVIHDAAVFGTQRDRWVIDTATLAAGETLLPEVRILLGETLRGLGTLVVDTTVEQFADLLFSLGLAELVDGRIGLVTDAVERFVIDPIGELRTRLDMARVEIRAALARLVPVDFGVDRHQLVLSDAVTLVLDLDLDLVSCVSAEFSGVSIGGVFALSGGARACVDGTVTAELLAHSDDAPGPLGATALRITADFDGVDVQLESTIDDLRLPTLLPVPISIPPVDGDTSRLAVLVLRTIAGDVSRRAIEFMALQLSTQQAMYEAMFAQIGLIHGGRVRNLGPFLTLPAAWLSAPGVLATPTIPDGPWVPCLSRDGLADLLDAIAGVLDVPSNSGSLALPWGASVGVTAVGDGSGVHVEIGWDTPIADGNVTVEGALDLFVSCGLDVSATVTTTIEVTGTDLDHLRLTVDAGTEIDVAVAVKAAGADEIAITLLPTLGGLDAIDPAAAAQSLIALALDAVVIDTTITDLADAVAGIGDALGLLAPVVGPAPSFDPDALRRFAADPAAGLLASSLDAAFGDIRTLLALISIEAAVIGGPTPSVAFDVNDEARIELRWPLALCGTITGYRPVDGVVVDGEICIDSDDMVNPLQLRAEVEVDDPELLSVAGISLFPRIAFHLGGTGVTSSPDPSDRFEAGLWIEPPETVPRHGLLAKLPFGADTVVVCRTEDAASESDSETLDECLAAALSIWVTPLAAELLLEVTEVQTFLQQEITSAGTSLQSLLEDAGILDPGEFSLDPTAMADIVTRLLRLAAETIEAYAALAAIDIDPFTLTLTADDNGLDTSYGLTLGLGDDLVLASTSDIRLSITARAAAAERGGLTIELLRLRNSDFEPSFQPAIVIEDVGLRLDHPTGGKLVDLIAGVDATELLVDVDFGPGADTASVELGFDNLTLPIGIAQGDNPVAAKVLSSANEENQSGDTEELAPALNPRVELGILPAPSVTLRLDTGEPPWWIPIQRAFGPIYVEQIGGDTTLDAAGEVEKVHMLLDGEVSLAGLTVGVDDLALVIPVATAGDLATWGIDLAGLAVGYSGSGVELAGGFRKSITPAGTEYVGMAQLEAFGFGLSAIGAYGEFTDPAVTGETYTSMFVFAALSAPLGGPPFFFLTGIGAGFGLNRELELPDVEGIPGFPLVTAMNSGFAADPMGALEDVSGAFPGRNGTFWLAAGIKFNSFVLLETVAVLAVEIGDDVEVALLGLSHAALPDESAPIANIELALIARFSTEEGVLWVQAQLTDNSWLLDQDCRLTGGFAFVVWFNRGEFVFTVGGYHPRFSVPDYYPVVPRVGFNWTVDNALVIKGESYFALTSSAVMVGGSLEASYSTSTVWASLSTGVDALVQWDPFFYDISAYVRVSAGIDIRICVIWCARIRLSFSMGASVRVWGPKLQGSVTLELGPIDVTVTFGAGAKDEVVTIVWAEFVERFLVQGDPNGESMSLAITRGLLTPDRGETGETDEGTLTRPWRVLPEFTVRFETRAASTAVDADGTTSTVPAGSSVGNEIQAAPTGGAKFPSTFRVKLFDGENDPVPNGLEVEQFIISKLPDGPWVYIPRESRAPASDYIEAFTGVTMASTLEVANDDIMVALDLTDPPILTHPLPFHAELLSRLDDVDLRNLLVDAHGFLGAAPIDTDRVYGSAAGVLTSYSSTSRTTLSRDRVSPPRLAPLAEGLIDEVKAPILTQPLPAAAAPTPPDRSTKPPIVMGVLRGEPSPQARATGATTVKAAPDVPRVTAPTLASVQQSGTFGRVRLHVASAGVRAGNGTVLPLGHSPTTRSSVRGREHRGGFRTDRQTAKQLGLMARRLRNNGHRIAAGDVTVLAMPNERFDQQERRPRIDVEGNQLTRVVCLDPGGSPISETYAREDSIELSTSVSRIVVEGLGSTSLDPSKRARSGLAGWHAQVMVHQVASNTYLARESIICSAAPRTRRTGSAVSIANVTAREATAGRSVVTHLPKLTTAVLIGVASTEPVDDLTDAFASITIGLDGATRQTTPDGAAVPPQLVVAGDQLYGVFAVRPTRVRDAEDAAKAADDRWVRVTVESDRRWNVIAVGGAAGRAESLIDDLADGDPVALFSAGPDPSGSSTIRFHMPDSEPKPTKPTKRGATRS